MLIPVIVRVTRSQPLALDSPGSLPYSPFKSALDRMRTYREQCHATALHTHTLVLGPRERGEMIPNLEGVRVREAENHPTSFSFRNSGETQGTFVRDSADKTDLGESIASPSWKP